MPTMNLWWRLVIIYTTYGALQSMCTYMLVVQRNHVANHLISNGTLTQGTSLQVLKIKHKVFS
jgi:hypothetical protein